MNTNNRNRGVLYVVTTPHYTRAARRSALSVRSTNPDIGIGIYTDQHINDQLFDFIGKITEEGGRQKHLYLASSPFDETLYLDSDTLVTAPLDDLFNVLEKFEMAGASVRYRSSPKRNTNWQIKLPISFPQINCGVLLYKKSNEVNELFKQWSEAIHVGMFKRDQVPFREVLWKSKIKFHTLGPEYNLRNINFLASGRKVPLPLILHIKSFHAKAFWKRGLSYLLSWYLVYKSKLHYAKR
jgi:hypothetical protein